MATASVYDEAHSQSPPEDHIRTIAASQSKPETPSHPDFGLDSLFGLLMSFVAAPLYLYATLKGKFRVWDDILDSVPVDLLRKPTLDVGCGRGLVFLKIAERKKALQGDNEDVAKSYAIDIFSTADQTGNSPVATYKNAAAMGVVDLSVLHTASFTERLPFADGVFGLVTTSLSLHNVNRQGRLAAVEEMARVCASGGSIVIVDLYGYFNDHRAVLKDKLGWDGVDVSAVGFRMMYGVLPCQMLTATKP